MLILFSGYKTHYTLSTANSRGLRLFERGLDVERCCKEGLLCGVLVTSDARTV